MGVGNFKCFIAVLEVSIMLWKLLFLMFMSEMSRAMLPKMLALQMAPMSTQEVTTMVWRRPTGPKSLLVSKRIEE